MEISYQLRNALRGFFNQKNLTHLQYVGGDNSDIRVNSHNFNPVFIRAVNKPNGIVEIPSIMRDFDSETTMNRNDIGEIVAPLSVISSQSRRTAYSMLKYFFLSRNYADILGLKRAVTSKGEVYYGAPGLILDKDFNPVIIGVYTLSKDRTYAERFERNILKIDPKVFSSDGFLEKAIIKKLIPFYTSNDIDGKTVKVEVDNISQYVVKPNIPGANIQESMKELLSAYKDEILTGIL